jgi:hypothetical protein
MASQSGQVGIASMIADRRRRDTLQPRPLRSLPMRIPLLLLAVLLRWPAPATADATADSGDRPVLIHHVVLVELGSSEEAAEMIADCDRLLPAIPEVRNYWRGTPFEMGREAVRSDYSVGIGMAFASAADYEAYLADPRHEELVAKWRPRWRSSRIFDVGDPGSPAAGWRSLGEPVPLFDGRSLAGWTPFVPGGDGSTWSVVDGEIRCSGSPAGYLATDGVYESYELTLEWRWDPAAGAGNSGVLLRVAEADQVWPRSIEAQLFSGNAGDIWNIGEVPMRSEPSRTSGRRTAKAQPSSEKPIGEWNRYRIVMDRGDLELWVNGVLQNTASECEVRPGRIALQSEGAPIAFRNIVVRPIEGRSLHADGHDDLDGSADAGKRTVLGSASYRERIALPEGATISVSLVPLPAGTPLHTENVRVEGQVPLSWTLTFDPAILEEGVEYGIAVVLRHGMRPLFITPSPVPLAEAEGRNLLLVQPSGR